jgi:hypothetical protein
VVGGDEHEGAAIVQKEWMMKSNKDTLGGSGNSTEKKYSVIHRGDTGVTYTGKTKVESRSSCGKKQQTLESHTIDNDI